VANKTYLGDGVYAEWTDWGDLILTTENGIRATNTIVFEPDVLRSLVDLLKRRMGDDRG